jgi:hypothetical protein
MCWISNIYATEDNILWDEGNNGGHFLNEGKSGGYSDFAFILIKSVNSNVLAVVFSCMS